jgi:GNAT superfamily N-acetyltransferase
VPEFTIRAGTLDDLDAILEHRRGMFMDMGHPEAAVAEMCVEFRPWLARRMEAEEYLAWFAVANDGSIAAGLGLWLMDWPPHMIPGPPRANILNVYTRPESRRQGLARRLMETALDWCRDNDVHTVILHASDAGRPLYQSMGFRATPEMRMVLKR